MNAVSPLHSVRGFSITELMVALVLGGFIIAGVVGVYVANVRTSQVQQNLMQLQQNSQIAFTVLNKDAIHAGFSGCANMIRQRVVNVLNVPLPWWSIWTGGIRGFEQGAVPAMVAGITPLNTADAVHLMYGRGSSASVVSHSLTATPPLVVNQAAVAGIRTNDVVIACDSRMAVIFQVTALAANSISHAVGAGTPGNASNNFGVGANGITIAQTLSPDAGTVMPLESVGWFVGSADGVTSLYRVALTNGQMQAEQMIADVTDFQLQYLVRGAGSYVNASAVTDWEQVIALRATLVLAQNSQMPTAAGYRTYTAVMNLRNH
jgi:type IV pilus assembly protein PilW